MNRHRLFMGQEHKDIRLDFSNKTISKFIELWNEGYNDRYIARKLCLKTVEIMLIVIDLECAGKIGQRKGGLFGSIDNPF